MLDAVLPFQPLLPLPGLTPLPAPTRRTGRRRRATTVDGAMVAAPVSPAAPPPAVAASLAATPSTAPPPCAWDATELAAARRVVLSLASRWELTGAEALVLLGEPAAGEAERGERMCLLVRVTRLLQLIHTEPERARSTLRAPQHALDGTAPLALMLAEGCAGMARVRDWLVTQARCPSSRR